MTIFQVSISIKFILCQSLKQSREKEAVLMILAESGEFYKRRNLHQDHCVIFE